MTDNLPLIGQPPVTSTDLFEIKLALTRIEERTAAAAEAAEHRHANLRQAMENYVPRRELDQIFAGIGVRMASIEGELDDKAARSTLDALEKRVSKVESNQERVIWAVLSTLGMAAANLFGVTLKR